MNKPNHFLSIRMLSFIDDKSESKVINDNWYYRTKRTRHQQAGCLILYADGTDRWIGNSFIDQDYINHL